MKTHPDRVRAASKRHRDRVAHIIWSYKAAHPCIDCGEADTIVLDFDHVTGEKKGTINQMKNRDMPLERIIEEIEKCEIRCANCHRRATYRRMAARRNERLGLPRLVK